MNQAEAHAREAASTSTDPSLRARRLGILTQQEAVVFMRTNCHVCRSEGLGAHSREEVADHVLLLADGRLVGSRPNEW